MAMPHPATLLFGRGLSVIAIDLERMRRADRTFDLGRIAGELQHYFLQATGNKQAAEPFIGHFLWEYACHFPDRGRAFRSITGRLPFQMALTLLRIARNSWVSAHASPAAGGGSQNHFADTMTEIRALLFDVNGTLIDIETDEWMEESYRAIAHFLTYQGIALHRGEVRDLYFQIMKEQFAASTENYPEFDVVAVWREVLRRYATDYTRSLAPEKLRQMPLFLAEMQRGISRKRLVAFPQTQEDSGPIENALSPGGGLRCAKRLRFTGAAARRPGRVISRPSSSRATTAIASPTRACFKPP